MERDRIRGYVASLEQIVRNGHLWLKETLEDFQEMVQMVSPERAVPQSVIVDIRRIYKEMQDQLTKIRGLQQLLQGKYRQYCRRDPVRDKEIMEFAFLAKTCYLRFETALQQIEAKKRMKERERVLDRVHAGKFFQWFQFSENQNMLLQHLRGLTDLGYTLPPEGEGRERRRVTDEKPRSLSLFILSGEEGFMDGLQSRMRLRTYDISERYGKGEFRGALTHLKETSPSEVENVIRRFTGDQARSQLKCLLIPVQSPKDLGRKELGAARTILEGMAQGEIRILE
jgi:hypothetical protein